MPIRRKPISLTMQSGLLLVIMLAIPLPYAGAGQGWYLLYPPSPDGKEPLRAWHQFAAYGSAEGCERDKIRSIDSIKKDLAKVRLDAKNAKTEADARRWKEEIEINEDIHRQWARARCIASDDPRLK